MHDTSGTNDCKGTSASRSAHPAPRVEQIAAALQLYRAAPSLGVLEIRAFGRKAIGGKDDVWSGFFDDLTQAAEAAAALSARDEIKGTYVAMNPLDRKLLALAPNRLRPPGRSFPAGKDGDVTRRRWLLLDLDPVRPEDTNASEEEHTRALDAARYIASRLSGFGFPEGVLGSSGNGAHLVYAIDEPNDPATLDLVKSVLASLEALLASEHVHVDESVSNAARIWKLPGTVARKGPHEPERPWRLAQILSRPDVVAVVPRDALERVAAAAPAAPSGAPPARSHAVDPGDELARENHAAARKWLLAWIEQHGVPFKSALGGKWHLDCPWKGEHTMEGGDAVIGLLPDGAYYYKCHHAHCAHRGWAELREHYEPGSKARLEVARGEALAAAAAVAEAARAGLPAVFAGEDADLREQTAAAWAAIAKSNEPPRLFLHGDAPVRLERDEHGAPLLRELTVDRMRHEIARAAFWYKVKKSKQVPFHPPVAVAHDMRATPAPPLPEIVRIACAPVFATDGRLVVKEGYDPEARTLLHLGGLVVPPVPDAPTADDVRLARKLLLDETLGDFPFCGPADRAAAVALLLTPFVRDMISSPVPLFVLSKPAPGTGGGLLVDTIVTIVTGRPPGVMPELGDEESARKAITSVLRNASAYTLIDNVQRRLDSAALAAVVTATSWSDRLLGRSEMLRLPVATVFVVVGNNVSLSSELTRRAVPLLLDANMEHPENRDSFKHNPLRPWVLANRGELVAACCTLVRNWIARGRPRETGVSMGSFESWCETVGGILRAADIPALLDNKNEFREAADSERGVMEELVETWARLFGEKPIGVHDLLELVTQGSGGFDLGGGSPRSQRTRLGIAIRALRGRIFGEWRIESAGSYQGAARWRLVRGRGAEASGDRGAR